MLGRLLQALHERGIAQARFDVVAINAAAIAFYRAHGARPVGRRTNKDPRGDTEDLIFAIATAKAGGCASVP
jgi:ribosomal protein S18 acetylase RimI-like enzyme